MIGIYQDSFLDYLKDKLGGIVKTTSTNIIAPCPYCEYQQQKKHYHLYIALDAPMFHCFHASCEKSGNIRKLLTKIEGNDISESFVDKEKIKELKKHRVFTDKEDSNVRYQLPKLKLHNFMTKQLYIKRRLKYSNIPMSALKGLIFDIDEFIKINNVAVDETLFRLKPYLQSNFVGFLTEHNSTVMFRNIDHSHTFKFFKLRLQKTNFIDYYRLPAGKQDSKKIILAEGIFDILTEQIYDNLNLRQDALLYASVLSSKYQSLIQSIVFHEQVFRPDIIILSDRGIPLKQYENLYHFNSHVINTLVVYYNKTGKDFNDTPVTPEKYHIGRGRTRKWSPNSKMLKRR